MKPKNVIRASIVRLLLAGGLILIGLAIYRPDGDDGVAYLLMLIGIGWGLLELLILCGLVFMYGVSGLIHDASAVDERDPWHRW
jgi:hypothetical protein